MTKFKTVTKKEPTLLEAQDYVEGFVERLQLVNGDVMLFNEEGKLNNLPINQKATDIYIKNFGETDCIVGNAILIKKEILKDW